MRTEPHVKQAVILAAGRGTRLRPITDETPKALVPFLGRPLLDHAAAHVASSGVERVAVNTHHLGEQVASHVTEVLRRRYPHITWHVSVEHELLGTGGALAKLRGWLGAEPFLIVNADAVFDADLSALVRHRAAVGADALWMTTRDPRFEGLRVVETDSSANLVGISAKAKPEGMTFCGVHIATRGVLEVLPDGPSCVVREGYLPWITQGGVVTTWETPGFWADTGTPERYVDAHRRGLERVERWRSLGLLQVA